MAQFVQSTRGFGMLWKRDFMNLLTSPVMLLTNTLFPLLLILILGYLTRGQYGDTVTSYDYYGITLLVFHALNVSMTASNSFMERKLRASNMRVLYSPIRTSWVYLSKILATFVFTTLCMGMLAVLLVVLFGVHFGGKDAVYVFVALALFHLFSAAFGVWFCCLWKSEELANKILNVVNNVLALMGGLFFSWDSLGRTAETLSYFSPVKWVVDGLFRIVYDGSLWSFIPLASGLLIGTALLLLGCKLTFRTEEMV